MNRSAGLDGIRVLGIIAIVATHTWDDDVLHAVAFPWHVPVFFLLSGYLWKRRRPVAAEVRGRVQTLLLPYAAWFTIITVVATAAAIAQSALDVPALGRAMLGGDFAARPYSAFWFVTALFVATVSLRLLQRLPLWVPCLISAAVLAWATLMPAYAGDTPFAIAQGLAAMGLVVAGYGLQRARSRITRPVVTGVCMLSAGAALAVPFGYVNLKPLQLGTPVVSLLASILISAGLILVGEAGFQHASARVSRWVSTLARAGLVVILLHAAVLALLDTPPSGGVLDFVLALCVPWAIGLALLRIRWAWFLVGAKRPGDRPRITRRSLSRVEPTV